MEPAHFTPLFVEHLAQLLAGVQAQWQAGEHGHPLLHVRVEVKLLHPSCQPLVGILTGTSHKHLECLAGSQACDWEMRGIANGQHEIWLWHSMSMLVPSGSLAKVRKLSGNFDGRVIGAPQAFMLL